MAERYVKARLADPTQKLPLPGKSQLFTTSRDGEMVDTFDTFWKGLLSDGSLVLVDDPRVSPSSPNLKEPKNA